MELNEIAENAARVAAEREQKQGVKADTFSLLKHAAGEVIEATEAYINYMNAKGICEIEKAREHLEEELGDIVTCVLIAGVCEGIDIHEALEKCLQKNSKRVENE